MHGALWTLWVGAGFPVFSVTLHGRVVNDTMMVSDLEGP